ncbi:MAG: PAS domain-containing protein [Bacteroidota bacterium]
MAHSAEFLDQILSNTPDLIYVFDLTTKKNVYLNQEIGNFLGYTAKEVQAMGEQLLPALCHPEDFIRYLQEHFPALKTLPDGETTEFAYRMQHKSGQYKWFFSRERVIKRTSEGEPQWIVGLTRDIDRNLKTQDQLFAAKPIHKSATLPNAKHYLKQELYELIASDHKIFDFVQESSLDGIWYWDLEKQEHEWMSPKLWRTLGHDPADMPHDPAAWQDLIFPEDLKVAEDNFSQHLADPLHPYDQIVRYRHQDGRTVWIRCRGLAIRNAEGKAIRMLGAHIDVSSLKEKENELKKTKQLLEEVGSLAQVGGWELDLATEKITWTKATRDIHEAPPEFEPDLTSSINFYKPGYSQETIQRVVKQAMEKGTPYDEVLQIVTLRGKERWIRAIGKAEFRDGDCIRLYGTFQDVDQQVKSQDELKTFKRFFKQSGDLMAVLNEEGILVDINPCFVTALNTGGQRFSGREFVSLINPNDHAKVLAHLLPVTGNSQFMKFDARLISGRVIEWRITPDTYQSLFFVIGRDITQEKKARKQKAELNKKLAERTRHLELMTSNMTDLVCLHNPDGTYIYVSPSCERIFGYTVEELMPLSPYDLIHPDDIPLVRGNFHDPLLDSPADKINMQESEYRIRNKDGSYRWVRSRSSTVVENNEVIALTSTTRDITDEKEVARQIAEMDDLLVEKERYLKLMTDNMTDMVCLHKPNGDYLHVSPSVYRITGYTPEELAGHSPYDYFHPDDILTLQKESNHPLLGDSADNSEVEEIEFRFRKKSGAYVWLHTTSTTVVVDGEIMALTTASRDITAKKIAERTSLRYQKQLQRSNDELKNFAYIASHDLQEPLRMISSYLQLLESRYRDKLDQDARDFIDYSVDGAERMKRLINALLDYSRVERRFEQRHEIDLNQVIEVVQQNLAVSFQEHNVRLCCGHLPIVRGNDTLMIQLFQNLISNSIKFRSSDSVKIFINVQEKPYFWQFSVKDDGIGIEDKYQSKIFTIFKKLNPHISGTGIGLAVVKKVVELHQGEIWIESATEQGTTIFFTLSKALHYENNEFDRQNPVGIAGGR